MMAKTKTTKSKKTTARVAKGTGNLYSKQRFNAWLVAIFVLVVAIAGGLLVWDSMAKQNSTRITVPIKFRIYARQLKGGKLSSPSCTGSGCTRNIGIGSGSSGRVVSGKVNRNLRSIRVCAGFFVASDRSVVSLRINGREVKRKRYNISHNRAICSPEYTRLNKPNIRVVVNRQGAIGVSSMYGY